MATHHILLVSNALSPIYTGMKHYKADRYYLVGTQQTKREFQIIRDLWSEIDGRPESIHAENFIVHPDDVNNVQKQIQEIINQCKLGPDDHVYLNLTGGTKLMAIGAMAAAELLRGTHIYRDSEVQTSGSYQPRNYQNNIHGYYITQDGRMLIFPELEYHENTTSYLSTKEILVLNRNNIFHLEEGIAPDEHIINMCIKIKTFRSTYYNIWRNVIKYCKEEVLNKLTNKNQYNKDTQNSNDSDKRKSSIETNVIASFKCDDKEIELVWGNDSMSVRTAIGEELLSISDKEWVYYFIHGGWWEYLVYTAAYSWQGVKSIHRNTIIKFETKEDKNEIDILINTGRKLIMLECKVNTVDTDDINKMEIVRSKYGGFLSNVALVRFNRIKGDRTEDKHILERISDLKIGLIAVPPKVHYAEDFLKELTEFMHRNLDDLNDKKRI